MEVSSSAVEPLWKAAFGETERPKLYTSTSMDENEFQPLNDPQNFISDINEMTTQQLYAASSNNQLAMKEAQDEYLLIDSLIAHISDKEPRKSPQLLQHDKVFEDQKESQLYNYKYEASKVMTFAQPLEMDKFTERGRLDVQLYQEPFEQGGFVPKPKQYETKKGKAKNPKNVDDWKPIEKDGKKFIPRQQVHHPEYSKVQLWSLDINEITRPDTAGSEDSLALATPSRKAIDKRVARTRYNGTKVPLTRDVSEAPSRVTTPRSGRQGTPRAFKIRPATPPIPDLGGSPQPKRRKLNLPPQIPGARAYNTTPTQPMSAVSMRNHKWAGVDLVAYIKENHGWLHDDPARALRWKGSILAGQNPVRTWSMLKKWDDWHVEGRDKRPRNQNSNKKDQAKKVGRTTPRLLQSNGSSASPLASSRKNSAATIDANDMPARNPPKLRLNTGGAGMDEELQEQADQQLLDPLTESIKAEDDDEYRGRQAVMSASPGTPARRSLRSQKGGT